MKFNPARAEGRAITSTGVHVREHQFPPAPGTDVPHSQQGVNARDHQLPPAPGTSVPDHNLGVYSREHQIRPAPGTNVRHSLQGVNARDHQLPPAPGTGVPDHSSGVHESEDQIHPAPGTLPAPSEALKRVREVLEQNRLLSAQASSKRAKGWLQQGQVQPSGKKHGQSASPKQGTKQQCRPAPFTADRATSSSLGSARLDAYIKRGVIPLGGMQGQSMPAATLKRKADGPQRHGSPSRQPHAATPGVPLVGGLGIGLGGDGSPFVNRQEHHAKQKCLFVHNRQGETSQGDASDMRPSGRPPDGCHS